MSVRQVKKALIHMAESKFFDTVSGVLNINNTNNAITTAYRNVSLVPQGAQDSQRVGSKIHSSKLIVSYMIKPTVADTHPYNPRVIRMLVYRWKVDTALYDGLPGGVLENYFLSPSIINAPWLWRNIEDKDFDVIEDKKIIMTVDRPVYSETVTYTLNHEINYNNTAVTGDRQIFVVFLSEDNLLTEQYSVQFIARLTYKDM